MLLVSLVLHVQCAKKEQMCGQEWQNLPPVPSKTLDFVASCKSGRQETPCTKAYCVTCIWNSPHCWFWSRYGDKVEVAYPLKNWRCPSCRGICNCGRCMKERGFQPAGIRGRVGKTTRFPSVMERLGANRSKNINEVVDRKETSATEESVPGSDGRKDAGSSNSMEVHLSSEVNPRVGWRKRRVKSGFSPSCYHRAELITSHCCNHLTQFEQRNIGIMRPGRAII